jgi:hypothetical protein
VPLQRALLVSLGLHKGGWDITSDLVCVQSWPQTCIILTEETGPNAMNIRVSFISSMSLGRFAT